MDYAGFPHLVCSTGFEGDNAPWPAVPLQCRLYLLFAILPRYVHVLNMWRACRDVGTRGRRDVWLGLLELLCEARRDALWQRKLRAETDAELAVRVAAKREDLPVVGEHDAVVVTRHGEAHDPVGERPTDALRGVHILAVAMTQAATDTKAKAEELAGARDDKRMRCARARLLDRHAVEHRGDPASLDGSRPNARTGEV